MFRLTRLEVACSFAVLAGYIGAQTLVTGRITDPTGAIVPNAAVRIKLAGIGDGGRLPVEGACPAALTRATPEITLLAVAGQDGTFSFPVESRQSYELNVYVPGFNPLVKTIDVEAGPQFNTGDIELYISRGGGVEFFDRVNLLGIVGTKADLSMEDISKLPQRTLKTSVGALVTFRGVLLADALAKVSVPAGEVEIVPGATAPTCRFTAPSYRVTVYGRDNRRVTFTWSEIERGAVYLMTERDGKPLPDADGPFQLVPADKDDARWVRHVVSVTITRAEAGSTTAH